MKLERKIRNYYSGLEVPAMEKVLPDCAFAPPKKIVAQSHWKMTALAGCLSLLLLTSFLLLRGVGKPGGPHISVFPTIPTESKPTDPTNSSVPTNPTNPTNSSVPTNPTDPTKPTVPADPTEPTEPTNPTFPTEPAPSVDLSKVLEIDSGYMEWPKLNHWNQISEKNEYFVDDKVAKERTYTINGVVCNLIYTQSINFPIGDRIGHQYVVNGEEDKKITLDQNGNLMQILYAYTKLDISPTATLEEVLELLKAEMAKLFDLSYYNIIALPPKENYASEHASYSFSFRHAVDGYITDSISVAVKKDGSIFAVKRNQSATIDFELDIDEEKLETLAVAKLKNIYNTENTRYVKHYRTSTTYAQVPLTTVHNIVQYKGQLYVRYHIFVLYKDTQNVEHEVDPSILIPLEDVKPEFTQVPVEFIDFIKLNGISYDGDWRQTEVSADRIGEKIGEVSCLISSLYQDRKGNMYYGDGKGNLYSEIPNGAAAYNNVGTELFSVKDNEKAIAALVDGKYYLYTASQ